MKGPLSIHSRLRTRRPRFWPRFAGGLSLWLALITPLLALNPDRKAGGYSIQGWYTEHGLPSVKLRAITQTRDGYLWIATAQGIARFDGSQFTAYNESTHPELHGGGFYAVQEAPDGTLWFGGDKGLFRWRNNHFDRFTTQEGLADTYVRGLSLARDGTIVACTRAGYSFIRDGHITTPGGVWKQITGVARCYLERADGSALLGTEDGLWLIKGETIQRLSGTGDLPGREFSSLIETPDGSLWIGYSLGIRQIRPDGKSVDYGVAQGLTFPRVADLRSDRDGNLWIGTYSGGLYRMAHGKIEPATYAEHMGVVSIQQVHEDSEGGLWLAGAAGLFRLKDTLGDPIGIGEGLAQSTVFSVLEAHDGTWWIGVGGGVYHYDQTRATRLEVPAALGLDQVFSLAEDRDGTLWFGTLSGLYRHSGDTTVNLYERDQVSAWRKLIAERPGAILPGIAHRRINSIAVDSDGELWVASDGALYHGHEGRFRAYTTADQLPSNDFKSVIRARNGDIWVTAPPRGVACFHDGRWTNYLCGEALSDGFPRTVYEDRTGAIWVTTEGGGLNRFKEGHWRAFTARDGLAHNFISGITEDAQGNFWVACGRGIMRIPADQFDDLEAGRRGTLTPRMFNRFDGLPVGESNQQGSPSALRTRNGRVLFATDRGVAVIEPNDLKINKIVPPMHIERLVVNGIDANLSRPVIVPPGGNDVEVHYTAISLISPEKVRFKIRLDPVDRDWVDAGGRRDVRYPNLPPGNYTFRAVACNSDGLWSKEGVTVAFKVRPFFYQTTWFAGLCLLATGGGIVGAFRMRAVQAKRQMASLEVLVEERTRQLRSAKEAAEAAVIARNESFAALKLAQAEAVQEQERLKFIFEAVPIGISLVKERPDGTLIRLINDAFLQISGVTREQAQIKGIFTEFTHPEDRDRQAVFMDQFNEGKIKQFSLEKRYCKPDGQVTWVVLSFQRRTFPDGGFETLSTVVDITKLKRVQEEMAREHARFKFIFESLPVGVEWMLRGNVGSRIVNPAYARISGVPVDRCRELDLDRLATHPDDRAQQDVLHQKLIAGAIDQYAIEKRYVHTDGSACWAAQTVSFLRDSTNGEVQEISTLVDITTRKEADAELEQVHRRLVDTSREAGMAEVATGVLHNVGNVLNSVNVSATLVSDQIRRSKAVNVSKVSSLLQQHEANLATFLTEDPKGKMIPPYLSTLAGDLALEQKAMTAELEQLHRNINHIKEIVAMQQSYAKTSGVVETVSLPDLIEDAIHMNAGSFARHEVDVIREYTARPVVTLEKNKVIQILVNLLRNAKYACDESGRTDKLLKVGITADDYGVKIAVIDNGVGIPPENLTQIFAHGFTTRKAGHGFGLHSGALAARELGGSLLASSEGLGKGAMFVLQLPYKTERAVA